MSEGAEGTSNRLIRGSSEPARHVVIFRVHVITDPLASRRGEASFARQRAAEAAMGALPKVQDRLRMSKATTRIRLAPIELSVAV